MKLKLAFNKGDKKIIVKPVAILLIMALGMIIALFLAEYMLRKTVDLPLKEQYLKFRHLNNYSVPADFRHEKLFWKHKKVFFGVQHKMHKMHKRKGQFRIICLGDSVTQSHGKDGFPLDRKFTYEFSLEKLLNQKFNKGKVEVLNAGVGGYSSLQGVRYLKNVMWKYKPDLVISWFGINDDTDALFFEDKNQRFSEVISDERKSILEYSSLYLFLRNFVFTKRMRRVSAADYYRNCEEMLLFAREKGFDIVFVAPFNVDIKKNEMKYYIHYKNELDRLKKKYNCTVIDMLPYFADYKDVSKFFIDTAHPNFEGNKIIANCLSDSMFKFLK